MAATPSSTPSNRLLLLQTFVDHPPSSDFERGYFTALLDEAVDDIADAESEIFTQALELLDLQARRTYIARRTITLR